MVNSKKLKSKMVLFGDNNGSLAKFLGITRQSIGKKISGEQDFWQIEIKKISLRYKLTPNEISEIFFEEV